MVFSEEILADKPIKDNLIDIVRNNSKHMDPLPTELYAQLECPGTIKSIIFDIYGTLLISASGDIGKVRKSSKSDNLLNSLEKSGITILDRNAGQKGLEYLYNEIQLAHIASNIKGIEYPEVSIIEIWRNAISKLNRDGLINAKITENILLLTATYFECANNPVWPMPDLLEVLNILRNKNLILGIISNAQFYTPLIFPALTGQSLEELGFDPEIVQYSYKGKEAKPSLSMFKTVIKNLKVHYNIDPFDILYVGNDMLNDIYSAKMSGMKTALFAGDARSLRLRKNNPQVDEMKPDIILTKLAQIPNLFK